MSDDKHLDARLANLEKKVDSSQLWFIDLNKSNATIQTLLKQHIDWAEKIHEKQEAKIEELEQDVKVWKRLGAVLGGIAIAAGAFVGWLTGK